MALIKCSECGQMVSDKAGNCPHCGAPIEKRIVCEECGQELPASSATCPKCGCPVMLSSQPSVVIPHSKKEETMDTATKFFNWYEQHRKRIMGILTFIVAYGIIAILFLVIVSAVLVVA